jgi:hypothetical protein
MGSDEQWLNSISRKRLSNFKNLTQNCQVVVHDNPARFDVRLDFHTLFLLVDVERPFPRDSRQRRSFAQAKARGEIAGEAEIYFVYGCFRLAGIGAKMRANGNPLILLG